jgi:hypothetical protein
MAPRRKRDRISAVFRPKHPYLPGTEILRQIDIDAVAGELDLEASGDADGRAGTPPADGRSLSLKEREIVGRLRSLWETTIQGARRAHDAYRGRFASLTADSEVEELLGDPKAVAVMLRQASRDERDRLVLDHARVRETRSELERFKRREGIERPPVEDQHIVTKVTLLAFAALAELVVNTSIFAGGDEFGFVGAVTKVVVIPIVNIGGCWLWTYWLARNILARPLWRKAAGVFGIALAGAWLVCLNLAVAHWRDAAASAMNFDAAQFSLDQALRQPFHLRSFQSWGLFLIGCFAGAVAIFEGWNWTDPYPGYGRRSRHARLAADLWTDDRLAAIDRLHQLAEDNIGALKEAQRRAELATAERPDLAAKVAGLDEDLRAYAEHLRFVGDELVLRYRQANSRARPGESPPQFRQPLDFVFEAPSLAPLSSAPGQRIAGRLSRATQEITQALDAACSSIPLMSELDQEAPR